MWREAGREGKVVEAAEALHASRSPRRHGKEDPTWGEAPQVATNAARPHAGHRQHQRIGEDLIPGGAIGTRETTEALHTEIPQL